MNEQPSSLEIREFAYQIRNTTAPTRADIRSVVDSLNKSPSPKLFWQLSSLLRNAQPSEVKAVIDPIAKLVLNNRSEYAGAAFANAHLLRVAHSISYPDGYKWCRNFSFTNNIFYDAQLYNIIALPTYSNILAPQFEYLDCANYKVQKIGAAAISSHAKTPGNLLRRVLATICSSPQSNDVEILPLPEISTGTVYRMRGLILLASFLCSNPVGLSEYLNALLPILCRVPENDAERSLAIEAQLLLSKVMSSCPSAFHNSKIFDAAIVQIKSNNFSPSFLEAILVSFGIFSLKKLIIPLIPIWIDTLNSHETIEYLKIVAPYTKLFEPALQLQLHAALIEKCERNRFDTEIFSITATVLMCSHPTVSPLVGRFVEAAKRSVCRHEVMLKLKPILEPKSPPVLHPKRDSMKVKELEKRDAFTQVNPTVKSVLIGCDMSREIRNLPKPASQKTQTFKLPSKIAKTTNTAYNAKSISNETVNNTANNIVHYNSKDALKEKQTEKIDEVELKGKNTETAKNKSIEDSIDIDIDINLDGPDSDVSD